MAKSKKLNTRNLDELYQAYDKARSDAKEAEAIKVEAADTIKELLGETQEASTPNYVVTYKYDKDKEVESFDQEKFEEKDPKGYKLWQSIVEKAEAMAKKYTKKTIVKGTRKLVVTSTIQEE